MADQGKLTRRLAGLEEKITELRRLLGVKDKTIEGLLKERREMQGNLIRTQVPPPGRSPEAHYQHTRTQLRRAGVKEDDPTRSALLMSALAKHHQRKEGGSMSEKSHPKNLVRDTSPEQGHDLVILVESKATAWVFWRWGWPVSCGVLAGYFGPGFARSAAAEQTDKEVMGGFRAWAVFACDAVDAFCLGKYPFFRDVESCLPASDEEIARPNRLIKESAEYLSRTTGSDLLPIIHRTIAESMALGIACRENDQ